MVKTAGSIFSPDSTGTIRRRVRKKYPEPPPPPPLGRHVVVTAGAPAPDPDCTGIYLYLQDLYEEPAFRRKDTHDFFVWYNAGGFIWVISKALGDFPDGIIWEGKATMPGEYTGVASASGVAIVSEEQDA